MIQEGDAFPDFSLVDQEGNTRTLSEFAGRWLVVYFYPKDDTSGCTKEACEFRDLIPNIPGAQVLGVSPDGQSSHKKFAGKYDLNFPLLVDEGAELAQKLGIWVEKSMYGKKYMGIERSTFLIDADGKIQRVWRKVKPEGHAAEVIASLA